MTNRIEFGHHKGHLLLLPLLFVFRGSILLGSFHFRDRLLEFFQFGLRILVLFFEDVDSDETFLVVIAKPLNLETQLIQLSRHHLVLL